MRQILVEQATLQQDYNAPRHWTTINANVIVPVRGHL